MRKTWRCFRGAAAIGIMTAMCACARKETPVEAGNRTGTLHRGNLSEPQDIDPQRVTGVTEHNIISALLEGLVCEDPKTLAPIPGTAERWDVSADGTVYTFHLRADAKWSNGDPVTAPDFVFSYRRILSPGLASPYAYMLHAIVNAEAFNKGATNDFAAVGVKALDDRTLQLTLAYPVPYFLSLLNHYSWFPVHPPTILAHGAIDQLDTKWTEAGHFVGNGPFVLERWEPGDRIEVVKNSNYWDAARVKLNRIVFHPIGDAKTEERAFLSGQLHVTGTVPIDRIDHYRTKRPDVLRLDPYLGTYYYLMNVRRAPLDDVRVRRALSLALDRERLVKYVTKAGEDPALHFTPPGTAGYTPSARIRGGQEEARRLLAEAGYPGGKGLRRLEFLYNTSEAHANIAQVAQQMWKECLGLDIELVNMEWKVYLDRTQRGDYDLARAGWIGDYVDPNSFLDMWLTGGGNNRAGWSNAEYDRLIREAARTPAQAARYALFDKAETLLLDEMPIIPLYFYRSKALVQPSLAGWNPTILDHHPYPYVSLE